MYRKFVKRMLDIILSFIGLTVLSPVLLVLWAVVRIGLGKPAIFRQERPGRNEKVFTMKKFRTMTDKRDENGVLLPDKQRITALGRFLRATSLDELPELWNIFVGDMSFVGPRPLVTKYLPYYTELEHHRHDVPPGLTGWAQVNGRNNISWEEKFAYDLEYVEKCSFLFDCKVFFRTVVQVFRRENVVSDGTYTHAALDVERKAEKEKCLKKS